MGGENGIRPVGKPLHQYIRDDTCLDPGVGGFVIKKLDSKNILQTESKGFVGIRIYFNH